ncbi:MAG: Glu/Leu/Phe/Val dehydrogenase [Gemmatimonadetes bacterium]|nr:Glu/Leu/Phe/Val dehydrogenase [Gemmatimonadota bacterium]
MSGARARRPRRAHAPRALPMHGDGATATIVRTVHSGVVGLTAAVPAPFARRLGGVRFVQRGSVEEAVHLAQGMADKCAASRVPLGGQKALIICEAGVSADPAVRADMLAAHIRATLALEARGLYGPDMGCGSEVLDRLAGQPPFADHVTGLSESCFGVDINGRALTAHGVVAALEAFERLARPVGRSAAIQGFGMVGAPVAAELVARGFAVKAVSNARGVLHDPNGLDIPALLELWRAHGDGCLDAYQARPVAGARASTLRADPDLLFAIPVDVLVPAARTTVLACRDELTSARDENPNVVAIERFLDDTGCTLIAQAANRPLSPAAESAAEARGVALLPDVLINHGGMVGCYAEWRYRHLLADGTISADELAAQCRAYSARVAEENVRALLAHAGPARTATADIIQANRRAMDSLDSYDDLFTLEPT